MCVCVCVCVRARARVLLLFNFFSLLSFASVTSLSLSPPCDQGGGINTEARSAPSASQGLDPFAGFPGTFSQPGHRDGGRSSAGRFKSDHPCKHMEIARKQGDISLSATRAPLLSPPPRRSCWRGRAGQPQRLPHLASGGHSRVCEPWLWAQRCRMPPSFRKRPT